VCQVVEHAVARAELKALKKLDAASKVRKDLYVHNSKVKDQRVVMAKIRSTNSAASSRRSNPNNRRKAESSVKRSNDSRAQQLASNSTQNPSIIITGVLNGNNNGSHMFRNQSELDQLDGVFGSLSLNVSSREPDSPTSRFLFNPGSPVFVPNGHAEDDENDEDEMLETSAYAAE
jgi:hypothetical protein